MSRLPTSRLVGGAALTALAVCGTAIAQTLPVEQYPFVSGPVTITACSVGQNGNLVAANSLDVKYFQNERDRDLKSVTFRVRYAGKTATFTNNGSFTYQAPIEVKSNVLDGAPYAGAHPQVCRVLTATFADGTTVTPTYQRRRRGEPATGTQPSEPEASMSPDMAPDTTPSQPPEPASSTPP